MVTTIAMEMAAPPLVGFWLDQKLGIRLVFVSIGAIAGLALGMMSLIRLTRSEGKHGGRER